MSMAREQPVNYPDNYPDNWQPPKTTCQISRQLATTENNADRTGTEKTAQRVSKEEWKVSFSTTNEMRRLADIAGENVLSGYGQQYVAKLLVNAADLIEKNEAEIDRLRQALTFYANEANYEEAYSFGDPLHSVVQLDEGETARKALEGDTTE